MPVFPSGSTRTYHPVQYFPDDNQKASQKRFDGLVGGWMPAVRKILSPSMAAYDEVIVFGDVEARDKFCLSFRQIKWNTIRLGNCGNEVNHKSQWLEPEQEPAGTMPTRLQFNDALQIPLGGRVREQSLLSWAACSMSLG